MDGPPDDATLARLNNELLKEAPHETKEAPKRNSKQDLIKKLIDLCEEQGLELEHSDTKLRRMTKPELNALLAQKVQQSIKRQMADQVGAKSATDPVIALGALRMVHDLFAGVAERGMNAVLPKYGYEVDGFAKSLKDPTVREATDACLREIAAETDVLQYVESPYARLGIAWVGCLATCVRKKSHESIKKQEPRTDAPRMGPFTARVQDPVQLGTNWGTPNGKVDGRGVPFAFNEV